MRYAFHSWAYGSFPTWLPAFPLDEAMRRIRSAGYDGVEIGCAAPHAWPAYLSTSRRQEIGTRAAELGLAVVALLPAPGGGPGCNPCSFLAEERAQAIRHYREVVDLAADLGSPMVLYVAGWRGYGVERQQAWAWSLAALRSVADHAAARGITIVVEPTSADSNLVDSASDAVAMMRESGRGNVKLMFDTAHLLYRGEDGASYVQEMGADLVHIHAADTGRTAPGDGSFDWAGLMAALERAGYQGHVTVEAGFASRDVDPDDVARRGLEYLRAVERTTGRATQF